MLYMLKILMKFSFETQTFISNFFCSGLGWRSGLEFNTKVMFYKLKILTHLVSFHKVFIKVKIKVVRAEWLVSAQSRMKNYKRKWGRPSFLQVTTLHSHNSTRHSSIWSQLDTAQLYTNTTRYSTTQHATIRHGHNSTRHNCTQTTWS